MALGKSLYILMSILALMRASMLPRFRKKVSSYLCGETGTITKRSILAIGAFVGSATVSGILSSMPTKALTAELTFGDGKATIKGDTYVDYDDHSDHSDRWSES
jgi:hypothetical protein